MAVKRNKLILMHQTHSNKVIEIKRNNYKKKIIADAMITKMTDIAIGVLTADCVPVIIYDAKNKFIGCIHAGWKGALTGIIENTIKMLTKLNSNNKLYASVGPCIGKKKVMKWIFYFMKSLCQNLGRIKFILKIRVKQKNCLI